MVKSADPNETSKCVRRPASRSRSSRSNPRTAPRAAASASRPSTSGHESDGILEASGSTGSLLLGRRDPLDSHRRQLEQLIQALARKRLSLGGRLHLDEASLPGHDDVHVDLGTRVFRVVEVEQRLAVDYADGNGRDRVRQRLREPEPVEREPRRDVGAADRRAARAAVSLENVAVEPERPLAERPEIGHRPQGPPDQTLDLDRAPSLLAARRFPLGALAGRRRQQRVLGGHPAAPLAHQPAGDTLLDRGRAEDLRLALRVEHRTVRSLEPVRLQQQRTELVRPPAISAIHLSTLFVTTSDPKDGFWTAAAASQATPRSCRPPQRRQLDVLDLGDRQLQKPLAQRAERFRIAGGQEPVRALARLVVLDPLAGERPSDLSRGLLGREDERDASPEHTLEDGADQRVVRAAEDDRVNPSVLQGLCVLADRRGGLRAERIVALDQRHEPRAGQRRELATGVERGNELGVAPGLDRRLGREQADLAVAGRLYGRVRLGLDHTDDRNRERLLELWQSGRG